MQQKRSKLQLSFHTFFIIYKTQFTITNHKLFSPVHTLLIYANTHHFVQPCFFIPYFLQHKWNQQKIIQNIYNPLFVLHPQTFPSISDLLVIREVLRQLSVQIEKSISSSIIISMQNQQIFANSQSNLQMPSLLIHAPPICCNSPFLTKSKTNTEEYSWIDEYLNLEVFKMPHQHYQLLSPLKPSNSVSIKNQVDTQSKDNIASLQSAQRKNRSIFHNFQKHIITLLKRIVNLRRIELLSSPSGLRAYQFWKLFKISKDYTKKTLYMIFGVAQHENIKNLKKLAQQLPDLQKILEKMSKEDIEATQALLRQKIGAQISGFQKEFIRHNCKMEKFEEFHSYFLNFIDQLQNPCLSKRLRKDKKRKLVESGISQEQQRE